MAKRSLLEIFGMISAIICIFAGIFALKYMFLESIVMIAVSIISLIMGIKGID